MARPKLGETETERMQLKITTAEVEAIDDWRFANRVPSRSEAVRRLCQIAIALEPLVGDLKQLWEDVQRADADIGGRILDAYANIDTTPFEESLREIDRAVDKLVPSSLELGVHAAAMADVLEALKSGETIESSIEDMKARVRDREGVRAFVKKSWGAKE